jgi:hypothetical protein
MIFREAVFSIIFLASNNFDRKAFQQIISKAMGVMGYNTERYGPWGLYEKGYRYKHLFNMDAIEKYFEGRSLLKYVLFVGDLKCFINNSYDKNEFEKECQNIYRSLYFALTQKFPEINIVALDMPEETYLSLYKPL